MKRKLIAFAAAMMLTVSTAGLINAATPNKPVELAADTIEYDSPKGIMVAEGNVRLTQDGAVMTGAKAEYNTKSKEAYVTGGVKVIKEDATLTSAEVRAYDNNHLIATGNALLIKGDNTLAGPQIDYYSDRQYALVEGWAKLTMPDGVMTANKVEAFIDEDRMVGTGNVHIVSDTRKLDATSNTATYYGSKNKQQQGKVILNGNARAVQDGNVLTGNTLTIYLDDKAMEASGGRNKLVIQPQ